MKIHTTNYTNTFIEVADDCPASTGAKPPIKGDSKTIANMQFDILEKNPYKYTSDDVLFQVYAERNELPKEEREKAREQFFSKGQPCFRASPLTKRYGWGVHCDANGKIALYGYGSAEYKRLSADKKLQVIKAMKSQR
jgi:hypothetical protein